MNRTNGILLTAIALVVATLVWQRHGAQDAATAARLAVLAVQRARIDSVYVRDTVTLRSWRTRYDSARVTDTLVRVDTLSQERVVYVPRATADSTILACAAVVQTCERRVAIRDSAYAVLLAARQPCRRFGIPCPTVVIGPGVQVGPDGSPRVGLQVTVGIPVR